MFCGLMSRWTNPAACTKASASTTWEVKETIVFGGAALFSNEFFERPSLHVLHRDIVGSARVSPIVDLDYVRVIETRRRSGLTSKALDRLLVARVPIRQ